MENKIYRKNETLYKNIHLKKLFDVLYQVSLRKHSAKAVSSGFLLAMVCILFFCSTVPESGNFDSRSGQKFGAFRLEGRKLFLYLKPGL